MNQGNMPKSRSLSTAANLANLLPTGTVLAFQALAPSFSNNGSCLPANKYLTLSIIVFYSVVCFFSSFTDSFNDNGKIVYGIATFQGLYTFNKEDQEDEETDNEKADAAGKEFNKNEYLRKFKIHPRDFVHAFSSLVVFLVFATSSSDVQRCFFPNVGANGNTLLRNLPIAVGAFASFLFLLFPTERRGIGYADSPPGKCPKCSSSSLNKKGKPETG